MRDGLHDLKYKGERRLAEPFGAAVARRWARVGSGAVVVVPVPVHADRERRRGYDQAALIAAVAARELGLPLARALERRRATIAQFELGRDERATNVEGAFAVRTSGPLPVMHVDCITGTPGTGGRRSLGPARRRRRHHRRDPGRLWHGPATGRRHRCQRDRGRPGAMSRAGTGRAYTRWQAVNGTNIALHRRTRTGGHWPGGYA